MIRVAFVFHEVKSNIIFIFPEDGKKGVRDTVVLYFGNWRGMERRG